MMAHWYEVLVAEGDGRWMTVCYAHHLGEPGQPGQVICGPAVRMTLDEADRCAEAYRTVGLKARIVDHEGNGTWQENSLAGAEGHSLRA
jgi:hypothetical protein